MNTIITGRTEPAIRYKMQGIYLCQKLNKHLSIKKSRMNIEMIRETCQYLILFLFFIINDLQNYKLQPRESKETGSQYTAFNCIHFIIN